MPTQNILFATQNGVVKRCRKADFANIRTNGLKAVNLREGDTLRWVRTTAGQSRVVMVTKNGQAVVFDENDVRVMGRTAAGVRGIRLKTGDIVVETNATDNENAQILTVTRNGYAKRTPISEYRETSRGAGGVKTHNVNAKTGPIVSAKILENIDGDIMIVSKNGTVIRTPLKKVSKLGRSTGGVRVMKLASDDEVTAVDIFAAEEDEK